MTISCVCCSAEVESNWAAARTSEFCLLFPFYTQLKGFKAWDAYLEKATYKETKNTEKSWGKRSKKISCCQDIRVLFALSKSAKSTESAKRTKIAKSAKSAKNYQKYQNYQKCQIYALCQKCQKIPKVPKVQYCRPRQTIADHGRPKHSDIRGASSISDAFIQSGRRSSLPPRHDHF